MMQLYWVALKSIWTKDPSLYAYLDPDAGAAGRQL